MVAPDSSIGAGKIGRCTAALEVREEGATPGLLDMMRDHGGDATLHNNDGLPPVGVWSVVFDFVSEVARDVDSQTTGLCSQFDSFPMICQAARAKLLTKARSGL